MRTAFGRVHRAAAVLRNKKGLDAAGVRYTIDFFEGALHDRARGFTVTESGITVVPKGTVVES